MNCKDFVDFLNAYAEGDLKAKLRESFERHMSDCPACRHFLDGYQKTSHLARRCAHEESTLEEPPEALVNAILAACAEVGCGESSGDDS